MAYFPDTGVTPGNRISLSIQKLILIFLLFIGTSVIAEAQTYWYKTTSFAYRQVVGYGWSDWTPWEPTNMYILIDLDRDIIKVFSSVIQIYFVWAMTKPTPTRRVVNRYSQIYVDFSDVMWVYNVIRIK